MTILAAAVSFASSKRRKRAAQKNNRAKISPPGANLLPVSKYYHYIIIGEPVRRIAGDLYRKRFEHHRALHQKLIRRRGSGVRRIPQYLLV